MPKARLVVCSLVVVLAPLRIAPAAEPGPVRRTQNIILVTADGLRPQELFTGVDAALLDKEAGGVENVERLREAYWRDTARQRREVLLPFFWGTLAGKGIVLGHKARGSSVRVANPVRISYPGYAEILTGEPQLTILSNDPVRIPRETVLEFVRRKLDLDRKQVAAFCSWSVFDAITAHHKGSIVCNAGYQSVPDDLLTPGMRALNRLQHEMLTPWDTVRHDAVTAGLALEYLEAHRPRFLYLALGETDDWAHERRYDRVVSAARLFDDTLRNLWTTLESMDEYRGKTTLIITTDHGRGNTTQDWTDHGHRVVGAGDAWIAVIGPDTPDRGEVAPAPTYTLGNVAATALVLLGLDPNEFNPHAQPPIALAIE